MEIYNYTLQDMYSLHNARMNDEQCVQGTRCKRDPPSNIYLTLAGNIPLSLQSPCSLMAAANDGFWASHKRPEELKKMRMADRTAHV